MKFLKDSFTTQFPSSDKSRVSAYPVAVITILFFGCFLYVLNPVWAIVTVIILLQIATGIMLSFNHERFGISNRKKAWGVVGAFALTYLISLCFLIRHEVTGEAISLKLGIGTAVLITIFLAYLYYSMLKHNSPDQQKLQEMDQHIAETKQQNEQILEQTAAIPYLVDQETKEFHRDQQRLIAARLSFKFSEREIKIMDYHDKGYTQEMIADKFGNSVRTIQRDAARINKIYTDRGLPKRLLWNSRKRLD